MANALITIRSLYDRLSQTHKQLADYILTDSENVPFLSVHELARSGLRV